jgi:hypothetical protein
MALPRGRPFLVALRRQILSEHSTTFSPLIVKIVVTSAVSPSVIMTTNPKPPQIATRAHCPTNPNSMQWMILASAPITNHPSSVTAATATTAPRESKPLPTLAMTTSPACTRLHRISSCADPSLLTTRPLFDTTETPAAKTSAKRPPRARELRASAKDCLPR